MRKCFTLILLIIFLCTNTLAVLADGIGNDQAPNYPGAVDYRKHPISPSDTHQRPKAGFALSINSNGILGNEILSGMWNIEDDIPSTQDSPVITANAGDKIIISDRSSVGSGSHISQYDIQYRFIPKGENREDHIIQHAFVNNFASVKNIIENLPLNREGTYEIFLCVMDNAPTIPGTANWSANGNLRVLDTTNPNFPKGMFWYYTEALVEIGGSPPDFFSTPEGETEWKDSFLTCAKTYTGEIGEEITFEVNLYNIGTPEKTDFRAVWGGEGDSDKNGWKGKEAPFIAMSDDKVEPDLIYLEKGEHKTFDVTVKVPNVGKKLYFKANVDGKTPKNEVNRRFGDGFCFLSNFFKLFSP